MLWPRPSDFVWLYLCLSVLGVHAHFVFPAPPPCLDGGALYGRGRQLVAKMAKDTVGLRTLLCNLIVSCFCVRLIGMYILKIVLQQSLTYCQ